MVCVLDLVSGGAAVVRHYETESCKDSDDGSGHEIGHGPGQHGGDTKFGELAALFGSQRADSADLNADGAEIREAAKGEGGDGERSGIERVLHSAELCEGDKFVEHHAGAQQIANGGSVVPGN